MNLPKNDRYVYMLFADASADHPVLLAWKVDPNFPVYVGVGKHGTRRHKHHIVGKEKSNPAKNQFILECKAAGIPIRYVIPETCLTIDEACRGEIELISLWGRRELGGCLFNISAGGTGIRDPLPSSRAKMAAAQRALKRPAEYYAEMAAARRGWKQSSEHVAKRAAANRGGKRSLETCAKIGAVHRGKKASLETRARMSAARLGEKKPPGFGAKIAAANRLRHAAYARSPDQCEFVL